MNLIVAVSENLIIGHGQKLPWKLQDELKRYKEITMGGVLIMGRKTFDSIGRVLPGRESWVLTKDKTKKFPEGVRVFYSKEEIRKAIRQTERPVFVNGGGEIYKMFLPYVKKLFYTVVHTELKGDTLFPQVDWQKWQEITSFNHPQDERNEYSWTQKIYERI